MLSLLQDRLERRLSPYTLKMYVAPIAAHHNAVDVGSLGKYDLVMRFLGGNRMLNPPWMCLIPFWDLSVACLIYQELLFEPLVSAELKIHFSSLPSRGWGTCRDFGSANHVSRYPETPAPDMCPPGFLPKVPTAPFMVQVVNLQALSLEVADAALALMCRIQVPVVYSLSTLEVRRRERLSQSRAWLTG